MADACASQACERVCARAPPSATLGVRPLSRRWHEASQRLPGGAWGAGVRDPCRGLLAVPGSARGCLRLVRPLEFLKQQRVTGPFAGLPGAVEGERETVV